MRRPTLLPIDFSTIKPNERDASICFHGSKSGSLLCFTSYMPSHLCGHILPLGDLLKNNLVPFTGECGNSIQKDGIGHNNISVADKFNISSALAYANNKDGRAINWNVNTAINKLKELEQCNRNYDFNSAFSSKSKDKEIFIRKQIEKWKNLSHDLQGIVLKGYPVVYGFKNVKTEIVENRDISGECYIRGFVKPEQIASIYVPEKEIADVTNLIIRANIPNRIDIFPIESIR